LEQELQDVVKHRIQFRKLARSLFVNDKKWPWQATLIWALAAAWYGWLFSPLVVYRIAGVPALADLRVIEGQFRIEGPYTVYTSNLPPPRYYIDNESGSTRIHCGPLPHPNGCYGISYACRGPNVKAKIWYDRYFGILQLRCVERDGSETLLDYNHNVHLNVVRQLGSDGKGAGDRLPDPSVHLRAPGGSGLSRQRGGRRSPHLKASSPRLSRPRRPLPLLTLHPHRQRHAHPPPRHCAPATPIRQDHGGRIRIRDDHLGNLHREERQHQGRGQAARNGGQGRGELLHADAQALQADGGLVHHGAGAQQAPVERARLQALPVLAVGPVGVTHLGQVHARRPPASSGSRAAPARNQQTGRWSSGNDSSAVTTRSTMVTKASPSVTTPAQKTKTS
jgi:hypothetical protein